MDIPETLSWYDIPPSQREQVSERLAKMTEIPLSNAADSLGYIYFTAPKSLSRIQSVFVLEIILALLLIAFSSYGLFLLHRTEKDTLWIGLAKETAHQFGTPITSLMGWIDYLKESPGTGQDRPGMDRIIEYMTADLNHLRMIASRFGKVGSQTNLVPTELNTILLETVDYFQKRMPHLGSRIDIHLISKIEGVQVMLDPELFKWTLENLIKNCVDAMAKKGGSIIITASKSERHIYLQIRDEGKGIPRSQWKRIFDPGVTTKTRGWGLGLSLAKRIIEEYHQGQIRVVQSVPNEGTTFEIKLPIQSNSKR
jgi:signal transduction histidine kinase